jgi:hypothetical protein
MTVEGYHVSRYEYAPGQRVRLDPGQVTHFHDVLGAAGNIAGEERLNAHRPARWPCRYTCLYAFGTLADCSLYGGSQHKDEKVHYYRVRMDNAVRVPMVLVDQIRKQVDPTAAQTEQMAREYWQPSREWAYWEYLTDEIEIVEQVEPLGMGDFEVIGAQGSYIDDNELAKEFCRAVMEGKKP